MIVRAKPDRSQDLAKIAAVKAEVGPAAFAFTDEQILKLVEITGGVPLACDALCMIPQPTWMVKWMNGTDPRTTSRGRAILEEGRQGRT